MRIINLIILFIGLTSFSPSFNPSLLLNENNSQDSNYCEVHFSTISEQADSLSRYVTLATISDTNNRAKWEKKFFCAFPNSFEQMDALFGYNPDKRNENLYFSSSENYSDKGIMSNEIGFFSDLKSIPKNIYYEKYIGINIKGRWAADNIRSAFGFGYLIVNDTKNICEALSKFSDEEIKSVFRFIFDGPHPKHDHNYRLFKFLKLKFDPVDMRLGNLLTEAFETLMNENHDH